MLSLCLKYSHTLVDSGQGFFSSACSYVDSILCISAAILHPPRQRTLRKLTFLHNRLYGSVAPLPVAFTVYSKFINIEHVTLVLHYLWSSATHLLSGK